LPRRCADRKLADLGTHVTKIETPHGDYTRTSARPGSQSAIFHMLEFGDNSSRRPAAARTHIVFALLLGLAGRRHPPNPTRLKWPVIPAAHVGYDVLNCPSRRSRLAWPTPQRSTSGRTSELPPARRPAHPVCPDDRDSACRLISFARKCALFIGRNPQVTVAEDIPSLGVSVWNGGERDEPAGR
jgi:hypothetical protein